MRPIPFTRPDGSIVAVMSWNPLSIPNVIAWLLERGADCATYEVESDDGWDELRLTITNPDGTVVDYHEDDLVVRVRRPEGDQWERASTEEWRDHYEQLSSLPGPAGST